MDIKRYDSNIQKLINDVQDFGKIDAELSIKKCYKLIEYGNEHNDVSILGYGYYYLANINYYLNDGKLFFDTIPYAIKYLEESRQWELLARSYNVLGITAANRGNEPIALDYYFNGLSFCKKYNIPEVEVLLNVNCGALYLESKSYEEAKKYLNLGREYLKVHEDDKNYHSYMMCVYENLARCEIKECNYEKAQEYFDIIEKDHWDNSDYIDKLGVLCAKTDYYNSKGEIDKRDECIAEIDKALCDDITLMDMFDDLYLHAKLLFECDKDDEFWHMIDTIEPMLKSVNITYMLLKELALKIKYYRKHNIGADYLKSSGLYFELSERHEVESKIMVKNVLSLRSNLEYANEARRKAESENRILAVKSETDQLTGLYNRFKLNDYIDELFDQCMKTKKSMAVELIDIDYFKEYNDNYGHQAGDECIKAVAQALRTMAVNHAGFAVRYGGDEFVIIYSGINLETAEKYSKELKELIAANAMAHDYSEVASQVTISQGLCCDVPLKGNKVFDFLHKADILLYQTKNNGKNGYSVGVLNNVND